MNLARRVRELERAAREKNPAPAPPPPVPWRSEGERLRFVMELFALGKLRLEQYDERGGDGPFEDISLSVVEAMSDDELLAVLGFDSVAEFARAEERVRLEGARQAKLSPEEQRQRVIDALRARRGDL